MELSNCLSKKSDRINAPSPVGKPDSPTGPRVSETTAFITAMKYAKIILTITILLLTLPVAAQTRRALVIGLGEYLDSNWSVIHGDKDVPMIKTMLHHHGYNDIATLVNDQATKSAIINSLSDLCDKSETGDQIYIHFSGHGQRMTDLNGDEDDGWDETWVPYDAMQCYSDKYRGEKHLTDDEVGQWLTKIRHKIGDKGQILVVVDACHSGDSSRSIDDDCIRGAINNFVIPLSAKPQRTKKIVENWLTLSACKNFQLNCEIKTPNGYFGMLSYALSAMSPHLSRLNNIQIMGRLVNYINDNRGTLPQTPTLSGETTLYSLHSLF